MLNFSHTYLYFKDLIRTYFCEIYVYFIGFYEGKKTSFNPYYCLTWPSAGRSVRSTDVHKCAHAIRLVGRSTGRSTDGKYPLSGTAGRLGGWPTGCARSTRWSTGAPMVRNMTVGPVDRRVNFDLSGCQRLYFLRGYKSLGLFSINFWELFFLSF